MLLAKLEGRNCARVLKNTWHFEARFGLLLLQTQTVQSISVVRTSDFRLPKATLSLYRIKGNKYGPVQIFLNPNVRNCVLT